MTMVMGTSDAGNSLLLLSSNSSSSPPFASAASANSNSGFNDDDLSAYKNFLEGSRFWVQRVLVPAIMLIGSVGNGITIIIMTRRRMRSSTNNYLAALAIFDMLYLIFTFILSLSHYPNIKDPSNIVYWQLRPFALWIADGCAYTSVWVTVTFTIERWVVVKYPIKGKIYCTEALSRKVVIVVFVLCFLFTSPTPFEHKVIQRLDEQTNRTIVQNEWSSLGKNETYKSFYYWASSFLFTFIPLASLFCFNTGLILSVRDSRKQRSDMTQSRSQVRTSPRTGVGGGGGGVNVNVAGGGGFGHGGGGGLTASGGIAASGTSGHGSSSDTRSNVRTFMTTSGVASRLEQTSSQQETKITVMLIAVVILFMLCQLPSAVMLVLNAVHEYEWRSKEFYITYGLNNIFNFLVAINAAGNFFLYSFFSQRYRRTFVSLFCRCYKNRLSYLQSTCTTNTTAVYGKHRAKDQNGDEQLRAVAVTAPASTSTCISPSTAATTTRITKAATTATATATTASAATTATATAATKVGASDDGHHLKDLNSKCKENDSLNPIPPNEEPLPASHGQPHSSFNGIT